MRKQNEIYNKVKDIEDDNDINDMYKLPITHEVVIPGH